MWCGTAASGRLVSCIFESTPAGQKILEANGLDAEPSKASGEIIVRREILAGGKGRVFVDNQPATVTVLRQLAPELALIHAQSESLADFDSGQQRLLLDRFGGISTEATAVAFSEWREANQQLAASRAGRARSAAHARSMAVPAARRSVGASCSAGEDVALEENAGSGECRKTLMPRRLRV